MSDFENFVPEWPTLSFNGNVKEYEERLKEFWKEQDEKQRFCPSEIYY